MCIGLFFNHEDNSFGKTIDELEEYSFLPINNCFDDLTFRGCAWGIYGAISAEILYAILLGLSEYVAEGMELIFTSSGIYLISHVVIVVGLLVFIKIHVDEVSVTCLV